MSNITRRTLAAAIRERRAINAEFAARRAVWYDRYHLASDAPQTIAERNATARAEALNEILPLYAMGSYDMAYYPVGECDLIGDVLCADCARAYIKSNRPAEGYDAPKLHAESTDGYEGNDSADHLRCDDCQRVICRAWLRPAGHRDDRDLSWSHLRWLRAEEKNEANPAAVLGDPTRYRMFALRPYHRPNRYHTRVATLAIWRLRRDMDLLAEAM